MSKSTTTIGFILVILSVGMQMASFAMQSGMINSVRLSVVGQQGMPQVSQLQTSSSIFVAFGLFVCIAGVLFLVKGLKIRI